MKVEDSDLFIGVAHADKYQSGNWVSKRLVNKFMETVLTTVKEAGSNDVHEIGCGEGHILGILAKNNFSVRGCDLSSESLAVAASEASKRDLTLSLKHKSIYDLDPLEDSADTVICCEVLEHLEDPELALRKLISITKKDLIISVPREPIWHLLNMVRGKYLHALGNTPGHFQHWTKGMFIDFVSPACEIVAVKTPLPWTLIHCRPKSNRRV
ncbi:MAG: class I SAM-dependent methyltransferase [Gammaproteobacteria bacterium]